jgi:hypothetical protein
MTTNPTGAVPERSRLTSGLDTIKRLPFVKDRKKAHFMRKRSFWDVSWAISPETASDEQHAIGQELAMRALAFLSAEYSLPDLLNLVAEDMSLTDDGVMIKAGFWSAIRLYALAGYRAHGERLLQKEREGAALFLARYEAEEASKAVERRCQRLAGKEIRHD